MVPAPRFGGQFRFHGWRVGSTAEFLALSPDEAALVETKLVTKPSP